MTVQQLIDALQKVDPALPVWVEVIEPYDDDAELLAEPATAVEAVDMDTNFPRRVVIR